MSRGTGGEATKEAIRRMAVIEFRAHGFRDASLEDIARNLGITRAAVLYHFGCKVELLAAVLDPYLNAVEALLAGFDVEVELNAKQRRRLLTDIIDVFVTHHEVAGILIRDISSSSNPIAVERAAALVEKFTVLMTRVHPTESDRLIVASILGAVLRPLTDPLIDPTDPETKAIINRIAGLISKQIPRDSLRNPVSAAGVGSSTADVVA